MHVLDEDLILLHINEETADEVISRLATSLASKGYVKESFLQAVLEREKVYPTGLPSQGVFVAIPHADPVHVNQSAIAVATLQHPVSFSMMGNPQETLGVNIVMLLAIHKPDEHIDLLKSLMGMFQNGELLLRIAESSSKDEVVDLFSKWGGK